MDLPFNTVQEFRSWWLKSGSPIRPPFKDAIHTTEIAYSLCIFRIENYQVELVITKPNTEAPMHSHPGVDSSFIYLTGNMIFKPEDLSPAFISSEHQVENTKTGAHKLLGIIVEDIPDTCDHTVQVLSEGGAFLSFERWNNQSTPVSVVTNWKGTPVGKEHAELINSSRE